MNGSIPPLPLYTINVCTEKILPLPYFFTFHKYGSDSMSHCETTIICHRHANLFPTGAIFNQKLQVLVSVVFQVASVLNGELNEITAQDDFGSDTKDNNFICEMVAKM